jgi:hypothetical protein
VPGVPLFEVQEYSRTGANYSIEFFTYRCDGNSFESKMGMVKDFNYSWGSCQINDWAEVDKIMAQSNYQPIRQGPTMAANPSNYPSNYVARGNSSLTIIKSANAATKVKATRVSLTKWPPGYSVEMKMDYKAGTVEPATEEKPKTRGPHKCHCPPECTSLLWGNGCRCNGL